MIVKLLSRKLAVAASLIPVLAWADNAGANPRDIHEYAGEAIAYTDRCPDFAIDSQALARHTLADGVADFAMLDERMIRFTRAKAIEAWADRSAEDVCAMGWKLFGSEGTWKAGILRRK